MYSTYLLALFLFLGVVGGKILARNSTSNDIIVFPVPLENGANFLMVAKDLGLEPKKLNNIEIVLNNVATKYLGPLPGKLSLRTAEDGKTGLINTIHMIGEAILSAIRNLFERLGLTVSTQRKPPNDQKLIDPTNLKFAVYYHLMRFPLALVPIFQSAKTQLNRHIQKHNYTKMGYKSVKFEFETNQENSSEEWKFLAIFGTIGIYSKNINKCLDEKSPNSFDLKEAVGHVTNFPPEVTGKILRNRLGKHLPNYSGIKKADYNQFHALVCHGIANASQVDFRNCLLEIKRVDLCVRKKMNNSSATEDPILKSSKDFFQTMKNLDDSYRDINKEANISLVSMLKKKSIRKNEFQYIVEFFMGDLKKSTTLERMAGEMGSLIKRSQISSKVTNEIASLIEVYKRVQEKKAELLKRAAKDTLQRNRYNRMSNYLTRFRNYCVDCANRTCEHLHHGMQSLNNVLVDPSYRIARENLTENAGVLKCWSNLAESIFEVWSIKPEPLPTAPPSKHNNKRSKSMGFAKRERLSGSTKDSKELSSIINSHQQSLNQLIKSMKRLAQYRHPRSSSALISLANTFLLATMFYESIAILAAAIYRQDSGTVSWSNDAGNEDDWLPRDRRSPPESSEFLIHEIQGTGYQDESSLRTNEISVGIEKNVGTHDVNALNASIESTTISNRLFVGPP